MTDRSSDGRDHTRHGVHEGRLLHASPVLPAAPARDNASEYDILCRRLAGWEHGLANEDSELVLNAIDAIRALEAEVAGYKQTAQQMADRWTATIADRDLLVGEVERLTCLYNARMLDLHAAQDRKTELQAEAASLKNQVLLQIRWTSEAQEELEDICNELPGVAFMDPPDGGSVSLAAQVRRMYAALQSRDADVARLTAVERAQDAVRDALLDERDRLTAEVAALRDERDIAVDMLAQWCVAVDEVGTYWDDWDEHYKNAMYRSSPIRALLNSAIDAARRAGEGEKS